jgi:ATP-binding cassette, subfamily B, bacterial
MVTAEHKAQPAGSRAGLLRRIGALFARYRGRVAALVVVILIGAGLALVTPILSKVVFDRAIFPKNGRPDLTLLVILVSAMLLATAFAGAAAIAQTYLASVLGQNVMHDLREQLYGHLQRMSLRFFTSTRTGEIQSRLSNDVGGVQTVVTETASQALSNAVFVLCALVAMFVLSWQLTLLSLLVVPFFTYVAYRVGRSRRAIVSSTQQSLAELSAMTQETLSVSGVLLTKVFDRQGHAIDRFRTESRRLADLQVRQQMVGRTSLGLGQMFFAISPALVYLVGGLAISRGASPHITAGTLVAFTAIQARLFVPVAQLLQMSIEIHSSLALFERVFQYLDLPLEIVDKPGARPLEKDDFRGRISLQNVSFSYEPQLLIDGGRNGERGSDAGSRWTLEDISLEVQPGQLAALVGPSGAGKTTITYLVTRLYDVARGRVEFDGRDVRDIQLSSLANLVGIVTQETYLFHASVRDNLLYAKPEATEAEMRAAARTAAIDARIMELPDGYDTVIGERGYRMSGGEKQRLAIARVLLKDPRILILDEATSALDTTNERLVQAALEPLLAGRTTIAVAHRLSTILAADVIYVLDRGRLVEHGSHEELARRNGLYARFFEMQFAGGVVEAQCEDGVVLASGEILPTAEPNLSPDR